VHASRFQLAGGDRNVGTVYLPEERPAPMPVLIVCFGGTSVRQLYPFTVELCARLTAAGAAVVTFDFYGWGETGGDPSGWTYGRWAANLADVCTYVSAQAWADAGRIGALGISAGSTAVLRCAIDTRKLAAGISIATFLGHYVSMPDGPAKQLIDHLDTLLAGGTVASKGRGSFVYHFGIDHFKDAIGGAPIYRLHTITCPIFFLQGGADNIYRRSDARLGYELLRSHGLPASYREIEAGDHVLGNVPHEGADAVLAWLREIAFLR
jgi:dipeptidyl aminopeptidase/acylaminoacyl peptidase